MWSAACLSGPGMGCIDGGLFQHLDSRARIRGLKAVAALRPGAGNHLMDHSRRPGQSPGNSPNQVVSA